MMGYGRSMKGFAFTTVWKRFLLVVLVFSLVGLVAACDDDELDEILNLVDSFDSSETSGDKAKYTVMVYLNGSDLESEGGMATDDLQEMIDASWGFDADEINLIVQTGGTQEWWDYDIPSSRLARYRIADDNIEELSREPLRSIGDPETLSSFIRYCQKEFPAERYALILWNHGGGALGGFGSDELYDYDGLSLLELRDALQQAGLAKNKLELLGFDACLMATIETATLLSDFARYLVASEELEPGYGWDYDTWLSELGENTEMKGDELGAIIADSYANFFRTNRIKEEGITLSVIDLEKVSSIVDALEDLVSVAGADLDDKYRNIARQRSRLFEFGEPTKYGGSNDIVDLGHMADLYAVLYPRESANLNKALHDAVVHKVQGSQAKYAGGLSIYYPYSNKDMIYDWIPEYQEIAFSKGYVNYVSNFVEELTGESFGYVDYSQYTPQQTDDQDFAIYLSNDDLEDIESIYFTAFMHIDEEHYLQIYQDSFVEIDDDGRILTEFDGYLTLIDDQIVCLYELDYDEDSIRYTVPGLLNGRRVNFIVLFDDENPEGIVLGARPTERPTKRIIEIEDGDEVAFSYYLSRFVDLDDDSEALEDDEIWFDGDPYIVRDDMVVENWEIDEGVYLYGFLIEDFWGNEYYTDFIEISFDE